MSDEKQPQTRRRTLVLGVAAIAAVIGLAVTDDGTIGGLAQCAISSGYAWTTVDGHPFTRHYFGQQYSGKADNLIDLQVELYGSYEPHVLHAIDDVLEKAHPDGDAVAVDVGANVGTHTIFLANRSRTVHAIEPWPTVLRRLEKHIEGLSNVVIHPVGLAAEEGTLPFHVPPDYNQGWGSFSSTYVDDHYGAGDVIQLPLVVADEYFSKKGVEHVDLIKVDIEGYEKPALQGFDDILQRDRPVVFFELNVHASEGFGSREELISTFPENYEFHEIVTPRHFAWRVGDELVMCMTDAYELVPFDMTFEEDGRNLVAAPAGLID